MAWDFTYRIRLVVSSDQYTFPELSKMLLPIESTPRSPVKGATHAVWVREFALVLKPEDSNDGFYDAFANELQIAVEALMPLKERLLRLSQSAMVEFIVSIFTGGHGVFTLEPELSSKLSSFGLPVVFEFYSYDYPNRSGAADNTS